MQKVAANIPMAPALEALTIEACRCAALRRRPPARPAGDAAAPAPACVRVHVCQHVCDTPVRRSAQELCALLHRTPNLTALTCRRSVDNFSVALVPHLPKSLLEACAAGGDALRASYRLRMGLAVRAARAVGIRGRLAAPAARGERGGPLRAPVEAGAQLCGSQLADEDILLLCEQCPLLTTLALGPADP